jgi:hypothetical protein
MSTGATYNGEQAAGWGREYFRRWNLIRNSSLTIQERWFLADILAYSGVKQDSADEVCFASIQTLARNCGLSRSQTCTVLNGLEAKGVISRQRRPPKTTVITVNWAASELSSGQDSPRDRTVQSTGQSLSGGPDSHCPVDLTATVQQAGPRRTTGRERGTTTGKTKRTARRGCGDSVKFDPEAVQIPTDLDCPEFGDAWRQFVTHRRQIRRPVTEASASQLLSTLKAAGRNEAIKALQKTVANGWQGVFPKDVDVEKIDGVSPGIAAFLRRHQEEGAA